MSNRNHVRTAEAFVLVYENGELWTDEVFPVERNAKTRFSQAYRNGKKNCLFKNQSDVRIERLISESVVENTLKRILEINQDNPNFAIEMAIENLRNELK